MPADRDEDSVRSFGSFTEDLHALADWLRGCGITSVAMESTSVYWIPLFLLLEERGFEVCLVNARHVKNVPGRKTDVLDCQWLQYLHSVALLRGSFHPPEAVSAVRSVLHHRQSLMQMAGSHVQHMRKALTQMNLHLHHVISDSALSDYFRRMRAWLGPAKAITAAAHKLARIVYHMLTTKQAYDESVFTQAEMRHQQRRARNLQRQAAAMGYSSSRWRRRRVVSEDLDLFHRSRASVRGRFRTPRTRQDTLLSLIVLMRAAARDGQRRRDGMQRATD